jgi:hypothetical protein
MTHKVRESMLNRTREDEAENEHADLQRRWRAYHGGEPTDLQALVDSTRHLESVTGAAPGHVAQRIPEGEVT